jgi:ribosome-binding factor A
MSASPSQVARARRLADRILRIVAETLRLRVKDPRVGFVTITEVRVTNDLREATVFWTVLPGDPSTAEADQAATAAALESAKGLLRTEVGRQTGVRHTPSLTFVRDAVPEQADRLEGLLAAARTKDDEVRRAAADALPAGDPDPYRRPRDEDDDEAGIDENDE